MSNKLYELATGTAELCEALEASGRHFLVVAPSAAVAYWSTSHWRPCRRALGALLGEVMPPRKGATSTLPMHTMA